MSIFTILCRFFVLTVFYIEYGFTVNDQDLILEINQMKDFVLNSKEQNTETHFYKMSNKGVCFESPTNGNKERISLFAQGRIDIFKIPDSLGGAEYCQFTFIMYIPSDKILVYEPSTLQFWDIEIKMFVFYYESVIKLFLRHETLTDIIVLEFDDVPLARKFWYWAQNEATPGKEEKRLDITVNKFETYLPNEGRLDRETAVKVDKSIVSDDLVSYAFWVENNAENNGGNDYEKKILLIFSSNRFTHSSVLSFEDHPIIIVRVQETSKQYYFVLHFDRPDDANQFFTDIDFYRGDTPLIPDQIVDSPWLGVDE